MLFKWKANLGICEEIKVGFGVPHSLRAMFESAGQGCRAYDNGWIRLPSRNDLMHAVVDCGTGLQGSWIWRSLTM